MIYEVQKHLLREQYFVGRWTGEINSEGDLVGYDWVGKDMTYSDAVDLCEKCKKGQLSESEILEMINRINEELGETEK